VGRRRIKRLAGKDADEPLGPEDWEAYYELGTLRINRVIKRGLRALPSEPRCRFCGAPFKGVGGRIVRPLGYRPSRKNPQICAVCVELAPPGGTTTDLGVLFADIRGFTTWSEQARPAEVSALLRRFYAHAEQTLFPDAIIDKLIGDEVMALYLPLMGASDDLPAMMLEHARSLLAAVAGGEDATDRIGVGVGLDFGEAYVGNIGDRGLFDFTAVGDVVNTAARLQGQAAAGEIVLSARLAAMLDEPPGEPVDHMLKGKAEPVAAYRVTV
jgi:adenylate cyclase